MNMAEIPKAKGQEGQNLASKILCHIEALMPENGASMQKVAMVK